MKKALLLSLFIILVVSVFAANPRVYNQWVTLNDGSNPPNTPVDGSIHPDYIYSVYNSSNPTNVIATDTAHNPGNVCIKLQTTSGKVIAFLNQSLFAANWPVGSTLHCTVTYVPTGASVTWTKVVPAGSVINDTVTPYVIPPAAVATATYTVNMSTNPVGYITPTMLGPTTDVTTLYGTYTPDPMPAPATGYWTPASLTIDATTVWTPDGDNFVLNQEFVWTEVNTYTYNVHINGPVGYTVTAPSTTVYNMGDIATATTEAALLGQYQASTPLAGWHWVVNPIEVVTGGWTQVSPGGKATGTRSNSSKVAYVYEKTITFALEQDAPTGIVVDEDGNVTGPATIVDGGTIPPELLGPDTNVPAVLYTLTATGLQDVEVFKPAQFTGDWYCWIKVGAMLYAGGNPIPGATLSWTFTGVDFGAKGDATVVVNDNMTLPVELSSFTATLTATYFVKLTWVSQSETGLLGYRVYRNSSNDQANAVMITPTMVPATNTSTTQTYSITDNEVSIGSTYWYWLESVDYGTSQFHGPVSVIVEGEVPPVIPTQTAMRNAYPNPFKVDGRTNIVVDVKADDAGSVTIYNILGQAVKTYNVLPGTNNITWNGRDNRGNVCGSGIYFYKLSTPSTNQTKKMVIVK